MHFVLSRRPASRPSTSCCGRHAVPAHLPAVRLRQAAVLMRIPPEASRDHVGGHHEPSAPLTGRIVEEGLRLHASRCAVDGGHESREHHAEPAVGEAPSPGPSHERLGDRRELGWCRLSAARSLSPTSAECCGSFSLKRLVLKRTPTCVASLPSRRSTRAALSCARRPRTAGRRSRRPGAEKLRERTICFLPGGVSSSSMQQRPWSSSQVRSSTTPPRRLTTPPGTLTKSSTVRTPRASSLRPSCLPRPRPPRRASPQRPSPCARAKGRPS